VKVKLVPATRPVTYDEGRRREYKRWCSGQSGIVWQSCKDDATVQLTSSAHSAQKHN